ncbi:MAG TPA: glycerophosphodiester phosphodiesterase [Tepidiformaceae bacterium]|nr:glycerophosphodiester phosphodiesterase [Tepidiformaceae bacterium]
MKSVPLVIGHACAAGEAPANTLAGVRACLDSGADAMEIDVRLSADNVPVLLHDETLDRTTNLSGPVRGYSVADLQAADAGGGEPVPSLAEVLDLVAGRMAVFCELKATVDMPELDQSLAGAVCSLIESLGATDWVGIHSFGLEIVGAARRHAPGVSAAVISPPVFGENRRALFNAAVVRGAQAVSVHHSSVDAGFVLAARRRQLRVWSWTPDEEGEWARLTVAGVDGIITNLPTALASFLGQRGD